MHEEQDIHRIIVRLFAGEAGEEEKQTIHEWLTHNQENRILLKDLQEIWLSAGVENNPDGFDIKRAIRQFRIKTGLSERKKLEIRLYPLIRYAAVLLFAIALPFSYYFGKKASLKNDDTTTITCASGDRTSIILPDSSKVILNSGSRLTFNNNFKNGSRSLYLDGEGYFSVRKDTHNPFRIKTSGIEVEVLGTEFNLKAYSDEGTISTTLVTGSLKVIGNNRSIILQPNQKLIFRQGSHEMSMAQMTDLLTETGWKDGRLVFRNQSLEELELKLERWFDVEIEFADEQVKSRRFTGILDRESILEVISYFGRSRYVAYKIKDNVVTFYTEH
ncbi:MAG: FecR family protein [Mangrovibacterium sp.]